MQRHGLPGLQAPVHQRSNTRRRRHGRCCPANASPISNLDSRELRREIVRSSKPPGASSRVPRPRRKLHGQHPCPCAAQQTPVCTQQRCLLYLIAWKAAAGEGSRSSRPHSSSPALAGLLASLEPENLNAGTVGGLGRGLGRLQGCPTCALPPTPAQPPTRRLLHPGRREAQCQQRAGTGGAHGRCQQRRWRRRRAAGRPGRGLWRCFCRRRCVKEEAPQRAAQQKLALCEMITVLMSSRRGCRHAERLPTEPAVPTSHPFTAPAADGRDSVQADRQLGGAHLGEV